ncbi:MAG: DUF2299 domain-containing protein [Acidilobus sp.]
MGLKDDVIKWLKDEDVDVEEVPVPQNVPVEWALNATVKAPLRVMIGVQRPRTRAERLVLSMVVKIADQHKAALTAMGERERVRAMSDLLSRLVGVCPDCIVVFQPQLENPDTIVVSRVLYDDQIGPSALGNTLRVLVNEYVVIVSYFNSQVGVTGGTSTMVHM